MNIKDELNLARLEQGYTYQTLAKQIPSLSTPQVKGVFEDESPDSRHLELVSKALNVDFDERPAKTKMLSLHKEPCLEARRKEQVTELRSQISDKQGSDKKTLKLAKGQACVRCGVDDGSTVSCHYTGLRQHQLGKGTGTKCNDLATAFLCYKCHTELDQPKERKSVEASEDFLFCIVQTLIKKIENEC